MATLQTAARRHRGIGAALAASVALALGAASEAVETPQVWHPLATFDSADGLPQNNVLALAFDADGRLLAGTRFGMARYDGVGWQAITIGADQPPSVGALAAGSDGHLWIGTGGSGLHRLIGRDTAATPVSGIPPQDTVFALQPLADGRVYVGTRQGLHRCRIESCEPVADTDGLVIRSLWLDPGPDPVLWVGTENGLRRIDDPEGPEPRLGPVRLGRADGIPNDIIIALRRWPLPNGPLWIGSGRGPARYDGERIRRWSTESGIPTTMVMAFATAREASGDEVLVAALRPGGLLAFAEDGRWRQIGTRDGLPDASVQSLVRDPARGTLWIGTQGGGLARTEPGRWVVFDERHGLPDRNAIALGFAATRDGGRRMWVGTTAGAAEWREGRFVELLPFSHRDRRVSAVLDLADGRRWVSTERGILLLRPDGAVAAELTVDNAGLPAVWNDSLVLRVLPDGEEEIWIGSGHGLARWRERDGLALVAGPEPEAARAQVRAIAIERTDHGDVVWVVQGDHLSAHGPDRIERRDECLGGETANDLAVGAGAVWLATDREIVRIEADRCEPIALPQPNLRISHLAVHDATLYAASQRGIWVVPLDRPQQAVLHTLADGLPALELTPGATLAVDPAGRVYAGTKNGVAMLEPVVPRPRDPPPRLDLAAFTGPDDEAIEPNAELPARAADASFRFRLLDLWQEHRIRYRTRLVGLEPQPGPWSTRTEIAFPRLPPGTYRFEVEAKDGAGGIHGPASVAFSVRAPWWQRPLAVGFAALALVAAGAAVGRWRARLLERRAAALEAEVAARTGELAEANRRLAEAAVTDPLTGLHNRRHYAEIESAEAERIRRRVLDGDRDLALLVAIVDVDHFKAINDRHGHAVGDAALVEIAARLRATVRGSDLAFRWGGEEFVVLARDLRRGEAQATLGRLLAGLSGPLTMATDEPVPLTVSIGASLFPPDPDCDRETDLEQAIRRADAALYRAKATGRDRAVLAMRSPADDADDWYQAIPRPPRSPSGPADAP